METIKLHGILTFNILSIATLHSTVSKNITVAVLGGGKERRRPRTPRSFAMPTAMEVAATAMRVMAAVALPRLSVPVKVQKRIFNPAA